MSGISYHQPVMTSDGEQLGLAQRILRNFEAEGVSTQPFEAFLKVFNFESGDSYFVPLEYISAETNGDSVALNITMRQVNRMLLSNMPRTVAYGMVTSEALG